MNKELTPMMELIEAMNESPLMFHSALSLISILKSVEKEKQVIEDAIKHGRNYPNEDGDQYYCETFKN